MKKLTLLFCCFLFIAGCQDQPSSSGDSSGASRPAAIESPAAPETQANAEGVQPAEEPPSAGSEETLNHPLKDKLAHRNFVIKSVDGEEFIIKLPEGVEGSPGTKPVFSFGQWPFANGKICNSYHGKIEIEGDKLYLRNAASTVMLCDDTGLNELESLFYQMLSSGVEISFGENDKTMIISGDGHALIFEPADYVN